MLMRGKRGVTMTTETNPHECPPLQKDVVQFYIERSRKAIALKRLAHLLTDRAA